MDLLPNGEIVIRPPFSYPPVDYADEVVWSGCRVHLAVAYDIFEPRMCNEVGRILWARAEAEKTIILGKPYDLLACCWRSPWCRWLTEDTFVFKSQKYDGTWIHTPLVVIHVTKGFQILPGTNTAGRWIDDLPSFGDRWIPFDEKKLVEQIQLSI